MLYYIRYLKTWKFLGIVDQYKIHKLQNYRMKDEELQYSNLETLLKN